MLYIQFITVSFLFNNCPNLSTRNKKNEMSMSSTPDETDETYLENKHTVSINRTNSMPTKELRRTSSGKNNQKKRPALGDVTNTQSENLPTKEKCVKIWTLKEKTKKTAATEERLNDISLMDRTPEHSPDGSLEFLTPLEEPIPVVDVKLTDFTTEYDESNRSNINEAPDYAPAIIQNLRHRERYFVIMEDYMDTVQTGINWNMRGTLVDWIVELQGSLGLHHESLYLAVKLVDMYLLQVEVSKENLQLVGAAAVYIAVKLDERVQVSKSDLVYLSDWVFNCSQLLAMERHILNTIKFQLVIPSSYDFLRRFAKCTRVPMTRLTLARYVLELSLLDETFLKVLASKMAAACLWLSFKMGEPFLEWDQQAVYYSDYEEKELMEVVVKLNNLLTIAPQSPLQTIRGKYLSHEFYRVAYIKPLTYERIEQEKSRIREASEVPMDH